MNGYICKLCNNKFKKKSEHRCRKTKKNKIKQAGIVIDGWKLEIFTSLLDKGNFFYERKVGIGWNTTLLLVDFHMIDLEKLTQIIVAAEDKVKLDPRSE